MYEFLVLGLATWRLANMLADVEQLGPFGLLAKFRMWVGVTFDAKSQPYGRNNFADGLLCVFCNSVWVGVFWTVLYWAWPTASLWLAFPFALSGVACFSTFMWSRS